MKHSVFLKIIFLSFLILFYQNLNASDIQSNGSGGGAWNIGTTWDGGVVPSAGDNVTIKSTDVVKIQQNVVNSPNNLTIIGTLTFGTGGSYSLTVSGDLLINSGGKLNVEADETNTNSHSLNLSGNFTNNGTFTSISGDDKINVIFQAVKDVSLSGTSQTDFQGLTINLTAGKTLDITSVITFPGAAEFTLTSGIFKLSSASTITPFSGGSEININSGFYLNHVSAVVNKFSSSGSLEVNGTLKIDNGTMTIGKTASNKMDINGSSAQFTMNGGTLNITGYWDQTSGGDAEITGGTINVNTVGGQDTQINIFNCPNGCDFIMSGGSLEIKNGNEKITTKEFYLNSSGATSVTGGTIKISNATGKTAPIFDCNATLNDFDCNVGNGDTLKSLKNFTVSGNFTITTGVFQLDPGVQLTVNGTTSLNGSESLILKSNASATASFINNGSIVVSGTVKVERYIAGYTSSADGWHLLSSPVNNFTISGSDFAPGSLDDFYRWDEVNNYWENWKPGNVFTSFENGRGYLVAYQDTATKIFSGDLNSSDITFSNLTLTGDSNNGWHLLGNPFPCALKWNDDNWTLTGIGGVAKIWDEAAGNYTDISANGIIPATQGFFVQAANSTNTITIPKISRTHSSTNFYKNQDKISGKLELVASGEVNSFYDKSYVVFKKNATADYDLEFDSHKLFGNENAPQLYSIISEQEKLSTNYLPQVSINTTVQLGLKVGISGTYFIEANNLNSFGALTEIILEDLFTGIFHDFRQDSIYSFNANPEDDEARFLLHFYDVTGINETNAAADVKIWTFDKNIYIKNNNSKTKKAYYQIYNIMGQKIIEGEIKNNSEIVLHLNVREGNYILRFVSDKVYTKKIFIK